MSTVRKKRSRGFDLPPENAADVEAHMLRFETELETVVDKQGRNSQIFTRERLNNIISKIENYDKMTWPVMPRINEINRACCVMNYAFLVFLCCILGIILNDVVFGPVLAYRKRGLLGVTDGTASITWKLCQAVIRSS